MTGMDYAVVGTVTFVQLLAALVSAHLWWCRRWPPYIVKISNLVVIMTMSGVLWTVVSLIQSGLWERREGDLLANCTLEKLLGWPAPTVILIAVFVRVYRSWRILIKHDRTMWRAEYQILFLGSFSLIPAVTVWIAPESAPFDEESNTCLDLGALKISELFLNIMMLFGIIFVWFVCVRQLKVVRKQFNEYSSTKNTFVFMIMLLLTVPALEALFLADNRSIERRVDLLLPAVITHFLLWKAIRVPFTKYFLRDEEYLLLFTKGLHTMPSPAQLKASLAEQLSVEKLREGFRRYMKARIAQELIDFYVDSLEREEIMDFFERQAATMRIIDKYIREDSEDQVNISGKCREKVLSTDVTEFNIFDEARAEVLSVMEMNFQEEFARTAEFQRIATASAQEKLDIELFGGTSPPPHESKPPSFKSPPWSPSLRNMNRALTAGHMGANGSGSLASNNNEDTGAATLRQQQEEAGPPEEHHRRDRPPGNFISRMMAAATAKVKRSTIIPQ